MSVSNPSRERNRVAILGIEVDRVSMEEALAIIESYIESGRPHMVVTADSSGIVRASRDPEFRDILASADLVTPDSVGVLWAAARRGLPIRSRVSGVDLVDRICAAGADKGYRLFFLGSAPGIAEQAADRMRLRYPGCNIVGARHGFFAADRDEAVAQEVAAAQPDVLFVAMGIPRQEKFIKATQAIIRAPVAIGVGGSLDVHSGRVKRAPGTVQRMRLEWLWRTLLNPRKIAKAKDLPVFWWRVLRGGS